MLKQFQLPITRPQNDFRQSHQPYRAFVGGRGAGKSFIGAYDMLQRAKPNRLYLVGTPTYTMLEDSSFRTFKQIGERLGLIRRVKLTDYRAFLHNGAEVIFRSADNPDRWRGPNISGAWLDEASQMAREAKEIVIACLREGGEQGWLTCTFTPRGRQHWTYETFGKPDDQGRPPENTFLARSPTSANPFLPPGFEDMIRRQYGPVLAQQELNGDFVDMEGAVFKASWLRYYRRDGDYFWPQVTDGRRFALRAADLRYFITVDLAASMKQTADFTVIAVWADDGNGLLLLVDLDRGRFEGPDIVPRIKAMQQKWRAQFVGIESVGYQLTTVQTARRAGLPVRELRPQKDKIARSIPATVRMAAGTVFFPENAPWAGDFIDEVLNFPAGAHDDCVDCFSYAAEEMTVLYDRGKPVPPKAISAGVAMAATPYTH